MKRVLVFVLFISLTGISFGQTDTVRALFGFPVTDYMPAQTDTLTIVQVMLPDASPVNIEKNQLGVLRHRFKNGESYDTAMIGWGRCSIIKGDYRYFGIHLSPGQKASPGDMLYLKLSIPLPYSGYLFDLSRHYIHLQMVDDSYVYRREDVYGFTSAAEENKILDTLVADIRFTGKAMLTQMPDNNRNITEGLYKGQKLFEAMQRADRAGLIKFLRYINARPQKYAGHSWKISEIFATWMDSGTPRVAGD